MYAKQIDNFIRHEIYAASIDNLITLQIPPLGTEILRRVPAYPYSVPSF